MKDLEHQEQKALIKWCEYMGYPHNLIFAIPNGGHRHIIVAVKLKAEGVKPSIPDLFLPVAAWGKHGMFIEMKSKKGKVTKKQKIKIDELRKEGYHAGVCFGFDEAKIDIEAYLKGR